MDNNTMVQGSKTVGREVPIATDIASNQLEGILGADVYADFPSSKTTSYETYSQRIPALVEALGNKDGVKG